jgi:hypothetical protein
MADSRLARRRRSGTGDPGFEALFPSRPEGSDMNIERDTLVNIGAPVVGVVVFIAVVAAIGATFDTGGLGETGAFALIVAIVLFVLGMGLVGMLTADEE